MTSEPNRPLGNEEEPVLDKPFTMACLCVRWGQGCVLTSLSASISLSMRVALSPLAPSIWPSSLLASSSSSWETQTSPQQNAPMLQIIQAQTPTGLRWAEESAWAL